jgi:hypothetical protein
MDAVARETCVRDLLPFVADYKAVLCPAKLGGGKLLRCGVKGDALSRLKRQYM